MPSSASRPVLVELLAAFGRAMRGRRWRWYVFGAQAIVAYGRPRMTADADVTVLIGKDSVHERSASQGCKQSSRSEAAGSISAV